MAGIALSGDAHGTLAGTHVFWDPTLPTPTKCTLCCACKLLRVREGIYLLATTLLKLRPKQTVSSFHSSSSSRGKRAP